MKKFLLGFLGGLVFAGLVAALLVFGFLAAFAVGDNKATVTDNSVLVLDLSGSVPERASVDIPIPFLGQEGGPTILDTWLLLRKAATDPRIKALVLEPRGLSVGWAKMEELRAQILEFKKSGKPVYANLRAASSKEYYLATAADQIFMPPDDWLDVKGLRAELTFLKNTLDKVGVSMEFEGIGLYKDAPDTYTKTSPSPQTLEVTNLILDQYYGDLIRVIGEGRKRTPEQARAAIDNGPFVGQGAVDNGMIDGLLFSDQVYDRLNGQVKAGSLKKVRASEYAKVPITGFEGPTRIAVIAGDGEILGAGAAESFDQTGMTGGGMAKVLKQVADDDSIKGVILRVDSPGGDAIASAEILHAAENLSKKKPLLVSMSDYAASGGYMMAMTGDRVLAYNNTLTGSIGVFFGKLTLKGFYDKIGLNKYLLKRGRWATIDSEYTPLSPEERARLQEELKLYYKGFVQRVADGRKKDYNVVEPLAQGRVWLGAQALKNGLVDEIGGLDRAVALIKEKSKIPAGDKITLVPYPEKRTLMQVILDRPQPSSEIDATIDKVMGGLPWRTLSKGGVLQTIPYAVTIK
ncbi:MAG: signal peptide peptidase SppA [Bryobacteraceae bacterium]